MNADVNAAFNVRATVTEAEFESTMRRYRAESERAVAGLRGHRGVVYDQVSGERLDIWGIGGEPRPVFVFLHGGYWRMLSRHDSAFMAAMLAEGRIATVAVDYTLAPRATLEEIVRQVRAAVAWLNQHGAEYGLDPRRIVVGGSSAGGQLTGMVMRDDWQAGFGVPPDAVSGALPISGLFDLRPLVRSFANEWLGLDEARAAALSPGLGLPTRFPPTVVAVAERDGTGFLAQSARFHRAWAAHSPNDCELLVVPGRNHFDVVLDLTDPHSPLSKALLALFGSG